MDIKDFKRSLQRFDNQTVDVNKMLVFASEFHASDLYVKVGEKPFITRYGVIEKIDSYPLTESFWTKWAEGAINSERNTHYVRRKMLDFSYTIMADTTRKPWRLARPDEMTRTDLTELRYRVSAGFSKGKNLATFRMISKELPSFRTIDFPEEPFKALKDSFNQPKGIDIIAGPTGSGKSTTMTAAINDFSLPLGVMDNSTIISLEDPIEYIHDTSKPHVNIIQKELSQDFLTFDEGITQALREHPNYIIVGEARDKKTIQATVNASLTGHFVITSFHSSDVADTLSRIYNTLAIENPEVMFDLINQTNLILCQRIKTNGEKFDLETQYMVFNDTIKLFLNKHISNGENIHLIMYQLFGNQKLKDLKLIKDWND